MTLEIEEIIEVAQIATIMSDENRFDYLYQIAKDKEGGYIGVAYKIGKWALEFYLNNRDKDWEAALDDEGCWDDIIINYTKQKIDEYKRLIV